MPVTAEQIKKGTRVESLNFGWMEAVSEPYASGLPRGDFRVDVRFDGTSTIRRGVVDRYFAGGYVRDGSVEIPKEEGAVYNTFSSGKALVVQYVSTKEIYVRFLNTGNVQEVQLDALVTGVVRDQKLYGDIAAANLAEETRTRQEREALESIRKEERRKEELAREAARASRIAKVEEKRLVDAEETRLRLEKSKQRREAKLSNIELVLAVAQKELDQTKKIKGILNVDFKDREGKWVLRFSMNGEFVQTRLGKLHNNLTQRVKKGGSYSKFNGAYDDVGISETFLDPQKFCDWAVQQRGWGMGYELDKDLLSGGGSRAYSEDICVFIPSEINVAIKQCKTQNVREYGVGQFAVDFSLGGKPARTPYAESVEGAMALYCEYKEAWVKKLGVEYRDALSERAFGALMRWKLNVQD